MPIKHQYDHYKVLGLSRDADAVQVKRAFRDLAKYCHPDVNPSPRAGIAFHAVHEAYRILSDPHSRADYDAQIRSYRSANTQAQMPPPHYAKSAARTSVAFQDSPPQPFELWAFRGLHLTGLLFGISLISTILVGLVFFDWPGFLLAFTAIGIGIIPESLDGLRPEKGTPH